MPYLIKVDKPIPNFLCLLLTFGPWSKCGHCCCKQASKVVVRWALRAKSWKMWHIQAACHLFPPQDLHPSVRPRLGVFVSPVLWQLDSCSVQLTFLSSKFPRGTCPTPPNPCPGEGMGQMRFVADGRQVHGQMAFTLPMLNSPRGAINSRLGWSPSGLLCAAATEVWNQVENNVNFYAISGLIEFGSKTFTSFTKVSRAA